MHIAQPRKKTAFPRIKSISLFNFDLYTNQPNVEVLVEKEVFCLIGANGLGKSTFLNTLNFVITGAIPNPERKFQSALDYYNHASRTDRTEDYFSGRIGETSRIIAKATVCLQWRDKSIEVTRDLFCGSLVSSITVTDHLTGSTVIYNTDGTVSGNDLTRQYEQEVCALTGLEDFEQFVFLNHFLLTFDEGRHLLMWDDSALTNALYLAFGTDPNQANEADKLQHDMDRESSRARNVKFAARHVSDRINQLTDLLKGEEKDDHISEVELKAKHENLINIYLDASSRIRLKQIEQREADTKWTDLSSRLTEAQLEYRKLFSMRLQKSTSIDYHPVIRAALSEDRCGICGTAHVSAVIQAKMATNSCPLCDSDIHAPQAGDDLLVTLRDLDKVIVDLRSELTSVMSVRERLSAELNAGMAAEMAAQNELKDFEKSESKILARADAGHSFSALRREIVKLEAEKSGFLVQSAEHYKKRDQIRATLRQYERVLKTQYDNAAESFVPRFRELAEEFIGLPVDVELEHRQGANVSGFGLRLRMNEQLRLSADKLSESQRFFIDIALRMALSEFMADGPATLLVDTPEGSLDIAYEARAGAMFSKFVANNNWIMMTANLRSSQLVLRLAQLQHSKGMQIVRMTDWTDLSEVQQSEEQLFLQAYSTIDEALI